MGVFILPSARTWICRTRSTLTAQHLGHLGQRVGLLAGEAEAQGDDPALAVAQELQGAPDALLEADVLDARGVGARPPRRR
jgi:hypothetical protein